MDKVSWGIIGCGNVTEVKSGPAFNKIEGSELVAVMRRDLEKAKDYAIRHKVPKFYSDADKLIEDKDINAIYIATPPDTHASFAIKALTSEKPVYVEKPMATTYADCLSMIEAAEKYKSPLFVAYYRRALPGFLKVKELINSNEIGKPLVVNLQLIKSPGKNEIEGNLNWRVLPEISGGGHFIDLASHQLDYFDYLFGPIKKVFGVATNLGGYYKAEDTVSAGFVFENGVVGNGSWCFTASDVANCDRIEIIGDRGRIIFSCFDFVPVICENENGRQIFSFEKPEHVQYYLIKQVVNELLGKGVSPSTGNTAARTTKVMEQILKAYYENIK